MAIERTLTIIKPDSASAGHIGEIIADIEKAGFRILGLKMVRLTTAQAEAFYAVHRERPFYKDLVRFMTEAPVVPIALERDNAVAALRELMGATDSKKAAAGTIRNQVRNGHRAQRDSRFRRARNRSQRAGFLLQPDRAQRLTGKPFFSSFASGRRQLRLRNG